MRDLAIGEADAWRCRAACELGVARAVALERRARAVAAPAVELGDEPVLAASRRRPRWPSTTGVRARASGGRSGRRGRATIAASKLAAGVRRARVLERASRMRARARPAGDGGERRRGRRAGAASRRPRRARASAALARRVPARSASVRATVVTGIRSWTVTCSGGRSSVACTRMPLRCRRPVPRDRDVDPAAGRCAQVPHSAAPCDVAQHGAGADRPDGSEPAAGAASAGGAPPRTPRDEAGSAVRASSRPPDLPLGRAERAERPSTSTTP